MPKQKNQNGEDPRLHIPVLLKQTLDYLDPKAGQSYLDLTAGYGGHAKVAIAQTAAPEKAVLVDRDNNAISYLKKHFPDSRVLRADFLSASEQLNQAGERFDMIMADLGVSSPHLEDASRGFSFSRSGPLDMRMDHSQTLTAEQIINGWSPDRLEQLFRSYGEEPKARAIVSQIVKNRPIRTTDKLAEVINQSRGLKRHRINRATKVFQALRIAVNDELGQLQSSLPIWLKLLAPRGRLVVISFHSLEDRLVKRFLADHSGGTYDAELELLTKKPVLADQHEVSLNPRARSAKLRAAVKK